MTNFLHKLRAWADAAAMLSSCATVLACVSGGADSTAMLHALLALAPQYKYRVAAAHFDHRLRGAESDRDREFTAELCGKLNVPCRVGHGDTRGYARERGLGVEEAARELRYAFFREVAAEIGGGVNIATAHNADDNAETMLLNLARGAGTRGLAGIPPVRGNVVRPMLCFTRAEIERYLAGNDLPYTVDSTNAEYDYARNKIRGLVMPVLRDINARISEHALAASRLLREDDEYITEHARAFIADNRTEGGVPARAFAALPRPVAARVIAELSGVRLPMARIAEIYELCGDTAGVKSLDLPGTMAVRARNVLKFLPPRPPRR